MLKEAREALNLTQEQLAQKVDVDRTTIGKWERGDSTPAPGEERARYADALEITLSELHSILSGLPNDDPDEVPRWLNLYLAREQSATEVDEHQPAIIAGLAQTLDYAEAVARSVGTVPQSDEYAQRNRDQRAFRQRRVHSGELTYVVLMPETPLHMQVGPPEVMADQLDHLVELGSLDNVTIQIVPFSAGQYEALRIGKFSLLHHPWSTIPGVHLEGYGGARIIDGRDEVAYFRDAFTHGQRQALTPKASAKLIGRLATQWRDQT